MRLICFWQVALLRRQLPPGHGGFPLYSLQKNPESDKLSDAKIWLEKTNVPLDNDAMAVANLEKVIDGNKVQ